jgi:predicted ATP-dependent endonuclease of OLD family
MLLKKVTIHKYKSFLTEQSFQVEDQITRIVGKNESGKTALLEALAKTNYFEDNKAFMFSKELDYPRGELTKVRNENPEAITCKYELSDEDIQSIADDFKAGIVEKQEFSVTSYYDNYLTEKGEN